MILRSIAKMLIQEHQYKPITGRVLCLGPQSVPMTYREVDALFPEQPSKKSPADGAINRDECATDEYFFKKFPIDRLDSLDVGDWGPGSTIIHDLNKPISDQWVGQFDFIVDGGTFDHLVNIGTGFENIVKLLKPGGRVFQYNAASNYMGTAYVTFGPDLFYDYYVMNGFRDCKVYVARETANYVNAPWEMFYLHHGRSKALNCGKHQMVIVLAEKGDVNRWDVMPVQYAYRSPEVRQSFYALQQEIWKSKRPALKGEVSLFAALREYLKTMQATLSKLRKTIQSGRFTFKFFKKQIRSTYIYVGKI